MKAVGSVARMWADVTYSNFTDSLAEMLLFSQKTLCGPDEYIHYLKGTYSWHAGCRNELVENAEGEWLFQTDTDHVFAPDVLTRLLRIMNREKVNIVSGIYQYKAQGSGHGPVAGLWTPDGRLQPLGDWDRSADAIDVGAVGGGCLLVRTELFKRMRAAFKCEPFDQIGGISEDFSFCRRAVQMGERVVLCPQIESHHVIRSILSVRDHVPAPGTLKVVSTQGGVTLPPETPATQLP